MVPRMVATLLTLAATAPALAQTVVYEGCSDASGNPVASRIDPALSRVVESGIEDGKPVIRYNPGVLPGLAPQARLFLFARECAHHALGHPIGRYTDAQAQRADCLAVTGMIGSGLAQREEARDIETALNLPAEDWSRLPGPPRIIDLQSCFSTHVLKLPPAEPPSARQAAWNACTRACADRLRPCQRGGAGEGHCLDSFNACEARCGEPGGAATSSGPSAPGSGR